VYAICAVMLDTQQSFCQLIIAFLSRSSAQISSIIYNFYIIIGMYDVTTDIKYSIEASYVQSWVVLASQAEAIVDRRETSPQSTKRRTGD